MPSQYIQNAVKSLEDALEHIRLSRMELDAEAAEVEAALTALGVHAVHMPDREASPPMRDRLLAFAATRDEFETPDAIAHIYGERFVERSKYTTVSSVLSALVKEGLLDKPARGRFCRLAPPSDSAQTIEINEGPTM